MASSDDEKEEMPEFVSHYYFEDDKAEPISFSVLPVCWNTKEVVQSTEKKIYVRGTSDDGLYTFYKPVKAWRFDLKGKKPEISVLSKDDSWIKLQKPRGSYEEFVRTMLITVNFLHLVKRNPELSGKVLWDKLSRIFGLLEVRPSPNDLIDQKALIERAVEHDDSLKKSKYLMAFLEKNPLKKKRAREDASTKRKCDFIVSDDDCVTAVLEEEHSGEEGSGNEEDDSGNEHGSGEEEDDEAFDSVCCICDNGGTLLICDGSCMRSFHATKKAADDAESNCDSLGLSEKEVAAMPIFMCLNCQYKRHQCYSCGQLGSSDKQLGAEVFQCVNATCGYYYHPHCVAKRLHSGNEDAAKELQQKIAAGESFTCPLHVCFDCRQPEDKTVTDLQMAVCRRCPKAYHRKCLPRKKIPFDKDIEDESIPARAWDKLLADRILIYCLKHEIIEDLGTPLRNHIKFPSDPEKKNELSTSPSRENNAATEVRRTSVGTTSESGAASDSIKKTVQRSHTIKSDKRTSKLRGTETLRSSFSEKRPAPVKAEQKSSKQLNWLNSSKADKLGKIHTTKAIKPLMGNSVPEIDSDSETRILDLMKEASAMITLDDIIGKHEKLISSRSYKQKMDPCKGITLGKVEGCCEAVRAATAKLDGGGSIEDAKAICEPNILSQMSRWKNKFKVYLAPFLNGMRYTSFGRHFTKIEKLMEIVDMIHCYVNNNDTIVDFCCGSNDFSWLMKDKLEKTGKTCQYKNYDLFRPKNDFNFETRDWLTVKPTELPTGSQLIMGLNPPFGVNASRANQFINKALEFKPKLLILIVPPETERLDKKKTPYDLVWEDQDKLSGKSFYLPGSVDTKDQQMEDWNVNAPILYLWSRPDWTARHVAIAKKHGHPNGGGKEGNHTNRHLDLSLKKMESTVAMKVDDVPPLAGRPAAEGLRERVEDEKADLGRKSAHRNHVTEKNKGVPLEKSAANRNSKKKRHSDDLREREAAAPSMEFKRHRPSPVSPHHGRPCRSPVNVRGDRMSSPVRYEHSPRNLEIRGHNHFEPSGFGDGRFPVEDRPFRFHGFPSDVEFRDATGEHFEAGSYVGRDFRRGDLGISGGHYNRTENYNSSFDTYSGGRERWSADADPRVDYPSRISPTPADYVPRVSGELAPSYFRGPEPSGVNPLDPEQRYRTPVYPTESAYSRMPAMSAMDKYNPRLDEMNHMRMNGYDPDMARSAEATMYNHQGPRQGYPGVPMGFAPGPLESFHPHHGSSGGWIND